MVSRLELLTAAWQKGLMNTPKLFFWPAILVVAAVVVAAAFLTLLKSAPEEVSGTAASAPVSTASPPRAPLADRGFADADFGAGPSRPFPHGGPLAAEDDEPVQPWEKPINDLLDSDEENDVVAAKLAALGPGLPLEGHVESIQHMVNLLDDEQYKLASDMLMNPSLYPEVREVIFSDVLDRPNEVKVPALLALLGTYGHPLQFEAREKLQLLLGTDLGNDPVAWRGSVATFLARSAAEEAAAEAASDEFEEPLGKGSE